MSLSEEKKDSLSGIHFRVNFISSLECKTFTIFTLQYTSHGGLYCRHQFGKTSITSKQ